MHKCIRCHRITYGPLYLIRQIFVFYILLAFLLEIFANLYNNNIAEQCFTTPKYEHSFIKTNSYFALHFSSAALYALFMFHLKNYKTHLSNSFELVFDSFFSLDKIMQRHHFAMQTILSNHKQNFYFFVNFLIFPVPDSRLTCLIHF